MLLLPGNVSQTRNTCAGTGMTDESPVRRSAAEDHGLSVKYAAMENMTYEDSIFKRQDKKAVSGCR